MFVLVSLAAASPSVTDLGFVLTPPESGPFATGINAPTVAWDGSQFVLFFESPAPAEEIPEDCVTSYRVGRATSPDGLTWTLDETPVLEADRDDPASEYSCSVAQPGVVFDGATWHLFFGMSDEKESDSATTNRPAGIGYATSADGVVFTVLEAPSAPGDVADQADTGDWHAPDDGTTERTTLGMPTPTIADGTLWLLYVSTTNVHVARHTSGGWELADEVVLYSGLMGSWAAYGLFSPVLVCDEHSLIAYLGGYGDSMGTTRSIGTATSRDGIAWTPADTNPLTSSDLGFDSLNHLDVTVAGGETLLWYSMTDPSTNLKAVGLAVSDTAWSEPGGRVCTFVEEPEEPDSGDTGDPPVTDDTGDTDPEDSAPVAEDDTGSPVEDPTPTKDGCGCGTGGPAALAPLLGALALLRRRRR